MAPVARKQLALDANVPLDLASEDPGVIAFHTEFLRRGYELFVTPTALQEIHVLSERGEPREKEIALVALQNILAWQIHPVNLIPVGHGLTERFAQTLIDRKLLPEDECNDGMILAETSLLEYPALVTSDHHLRDIDETDLRIAFDDCGLSYVWVVHPVRLLNSLR
ncbi:MAG TPA: hypothetical protein VL171_01470 [Verrucomicrobiae bacterium]|nr:hypothetical protein [Verrucomicrobiae bacterium]